MIVHFLSGLPRSGSTVLGAILNQNPSIHVTPTSPLHHLMVKLNEGFNYCRLQHTFDEERVSEKAYRGLAEAFYADERRTVFDKHRSWPANVNAIRRYINPAGKIVVTIRPIAEIIASYLVLIAKDASNFVDKHLAELGCLNPTNEDRANLLWEVYLKEPYDNTKRGLECHCEDILTVEYFDLVYDPHDTIDRIYSFCGLQKYQHRFDNLHETAPVERDDQWGLSDLHTVRSSLSCKSIDPADVLPKKAIEYFRQFDLGGPW